MKPTKAKLQDNAAETAKRYEPTPLEREAMDSLAARQKATQRIAGLKVTKDASGVLQLKPDHPDPAVAYAILMNALGITETAFLDGLLSQLVHTTTKGSTTSERDLDFMVSVVQCVEPRDQLEAMLAAQMAAVHMATMTFSRRLACVDNIAQQDSAERAFNKLARTFTTQMEALKHYRTGGQQRVTVEHVTVNEGGQAIVGAVSTGGGTIRKSEGQPHAKPIAYAPSETLPGNVEAFKEGVPVASC